MSVSKEKVSAKLSCSMRSNVLEAADIVGVRAVMVHAIDDGARRFYEYFNFDSSPVGPFQLMLLPKDVRKALPSTQRTVALSTPATYLLPSPTSTTPTMISPRPANLYRVMASLKNSFDHRSVQI